MKSTHLRQLLAPQSIAVVGASESSPMARNIVLPLLAAGRDVHLVHPRHAQLFDHPTHNSLAAIGRPVDAVVSLVNADATVDVVRQASELGCAGMVAIAGGFGESGAQGQALQHNLIQASDRGQLAVIGPNCAGFMNVVQDTWLFTGARLPVARGGIAVVSQSGFFTRAAFAAGLERRLGFSYGISCGNEAVCDLADYLDFLADDDATRVICLVIEKIRDAPRFFDAVRRTRAHNKPVIALKLGRSERGRAISQSHTGAIADDAWIYDVALRQAGILGARDIDDMLDQTQLFEQLDTSRWKPMPRAAVVTTSGGVAAYAADLFGDEQVALPVPDAVQDWVRAHIPEAGIANPIDMTGFVVGKAETTGAMFDCYAQAFDAVVLTWWTGEHDEHWATRLTDPFVAAAQRNPGTVMALTAAHAGNFGDWAVALRERGVIAARGLQSVARALRAMDRHMEARAIDTLSSPAATVCPRPAATPILTPEGLLLPFDATMLLLRSVGLSVAAYVLLDAKDPVPASFHTLGAAVVVKLANVAHRTEHGAVEVGVPAHGVAAAVERMRAIAQRDGLDPQVAVQALAHGSGELFVGIKGTSDLGPVLVCGLGGVFVELMKSVAGHVLPISALDADGLLDAVAGNSFLAGFRGQSPWDRQALRSLLQGVAQVGLGSQDWLAALDLNPVICSAQGCTVVDAVVLLRPA